jgi:ATP-binding cassette subfamily F protein uup
MSSVPSVSSASSVRAERKRLSYREARELDALPARIEALEAEQKALAERIASSEFYKEAAETINASLERVEALQRELLAVYTRWDELESRRQA